MKEETRAVLVQLPIAQLTTLANLLKASPGSTWHLNDCGCCVCVHPEGDNQRGWLIGADGESGYHGPEHEEPA